MEMVLKNGFCEMSHDEIDEVEGGAIWQWAVGAAGIAAAYNELYDLGYKIGSWFRK